MTRNLRLPLSALTLAALAACQVASPDADLGGARDEQAARSTERDTADTGAPEEDETVKADREDLETLSRRLVESLGLDPDNITIEYVGKGDLTDPEEIDDDIEGEPDEPGEVRVPEDIRSMRAFNPNTENEFVISFSDKVLDAVGEKSDREEMFYGSGAKDSRDPESDELASVEEMLKEGEAVAAPSWSDNVDNRVRLSKTTAEVPGTTGTTVWPWRAISRLGNGCTGTMIGPRHLLTAGHCIYNRTSNSWMTFTVTPGRAGATLAPYGSVSFPSAGFNWYFTPTGWRQASPSGGSRQYDFGLIILPERIGEDTGWMGWWVEGASSLSKKNHLNRGYPSCAATSGGVARTDDPGDPGSSVVCVAQHLYGDVNNCALGEFSKTDGDGWSRLFMHSCDASGGHSGSAVYHYEDGMPVVSGIHTYSTCGFTAATAACTASDDRPLGATRITPEYGDIIAFFRSWAP